MNSVAEDEYWRTAYVSAPYYSAGRTYDDYAPAYRIWGYPVVPIVYCLIMAAVFANMFVTPEQRSEARIGLGFMGLGAVVYLVVFRRSR